MAQEQGQSLQYVAGNAWNFGGQLQISEPDVFSCKLRLFPCAADSCSFVVNLVRLIREKRVTATCESKQPACSSISQSEHRNKLGHCFNIFRCPAKLSVSDLRGGCFAAGGAGRRTGVVFFYLLSNYVCLSSFGLLVFLYPSRRPICWLFVVWGFNEIV